MAKQGKTGAVRAAARIANGLCCSCSEPATHGCRCEEHYNIEQRAAAERYIWKKSDELCIKCRVQPKEEGKTCCRPCLDEQNEKTKARRAAKIEAGLHVPRPIYARRIEDGLCGLCGRRPFEPGRTACMECRTAQNERRRQPIELKRKPFTETLHFRRKAAGLCATPGCPGKPEEGKAECANCLMLRADARRDKIANLICVDCTKQAEPGNTRCSACQAKRKAVWSDRKSKGLCPACGKTPMADGKLCEPCLIKSRKKCRHAREKLKHQVFSNYGYQCKCCHSGDPAELTLDHVFGDGAARRRAIYGKNSSADAKIYRTLIREGYPDYIQVLCFNCNRSKGVGKTCAHQQQSLEDLQALRAFNEERAKRLFAPKIAALNEKYGTGKQPNSP